MAPPFKIAFYDAKEYDRKSFEQSIKQLKLHDQFEFLYLEPKLSLATVMFATGSNAVCCFVNDDLSAEVLAKLSEAGIELILMRCAGFDRVDLRACKELEISVARVPAYSPYSVAEFAIGLLLTINRKLHRAFNRVRDKNFTLSGLVGFDLHDRTVGVLGTGKIGQCFIDIAIGFGCNVVCYDVFQSDAVKAKKNTRYVELDELYAQSDVISIHAPLTKETHHLINKEAINKMKMGVIIINTSRGGLVDTRALLEGVTGGRIGGAGLDVYEHEDRFFFRDCSEEEIDDDVLVRLTNMRNVIVTSHQAFLTQEALNAIASTTIQNLKEFFVDHKRLKLLTNYVGPPEPPPALIKAVSRKFSADQKSVKA